MGVPAQTQTNVVPLDSELRRKGWLLEGLLQAKHKSLFEGLRGTSSDSVIMVKTDLSKGAGHEVVFQFDGKVTGAAKRGKERLRGNEEQKKLFSDKIRVERLRHGLDNGDDFDGVEVNNLAAAQHGHSRNLLADWYISQRDQAIIDAAQGFLNNEANSYVVGPNGHGTGGTAPIDSNDKFDYDFVLSVEEIIKDGMGFNGGKERAPLEPVTLADGQKQYLWFITSSQAAQMRSSTSSFFGMLQNADVRGSDNALIKGVVAKIGIFVFIELPTYMGKVEDKGMYGTEVEVVGARRYNVATGKWTGEDGFKSAGVVIDRGFILGKKALQEAFGKMPDYIYKSSEDYDITSGSAIELWAKTQKCILAAENGDYNQAIASGYPYGVIGVETYYKTFA